MVETAGEVRGDRLTEEGIDYSKIVQPYTLDYGTLDLASGAGTGTAQQSALYGDTYYGVAWTEESAKAMQEEDLGGVAEDYTKRFFSIEHPYGDGTADMMPENGATATVDATDKANSGTSNSLMDTIAHTFGFSSSKEGTQDTSPAATPAAGKKGKEPVMHEVPAELVPREIPSRYGLGDLASTTGTTTSENFYRRPVYGPAYTPTSTTKVTDVGADAKAITTSSDGNTAADTSVQTDTVDGDDGTSSGSGGDSASSTETAIDLYNAFFSQVDIADAEDDGTGETDSVALAFFGDEDDVDAVEEVDPFFEDDDVEDDDALGEKDESVGSSNETDTTGSSLGESFLSLFDTGSGTEEPTEEATNFTTTAPSMTLEEEVKESLNMHQEQDENGTTVFTEQVVASPVYVETKGGVDLSTKQEEVFESLEPILSRHLDTQFGAILDQYELTVTYVHGEGNAYQLRRGSEALTYITQLIVRVVLHISSSDKDELAALTPELATSAVQSFFEEGNPEQRLFLRVLNAKGVFTKEVQAQDTPHPPRTNAMEHGISSVTASNKTTFTVASDAQEVTDEKAWSVYSLWNNTNDRTAILVASIVGIFVILSVVGALCYNRSRRQKIMRGSRAVLDTASEYGSHAFETIKTQVRQSSQRTSSFLHSNIGRRRSTAASVRSGSSSSVSVYIQPAAIQLRRNRPSTVHVSDVPLAGRQDDAFDKDTKPSSIYNIDINDDKDLVGVRQQASKGNTASMPAPYVYESKSNVASMPDPHDYESQSSDEESGSSRQSSVDRISIARSTMAMEDRFVDEDDEESDDSTSVEYNDDDDEDEEVGYSYQTKRRSYIRAAIANARIRKGSYKQAPNQDPPKPQKQTSYTDASEYVYSPPVSTRDNHELTAQMTLSPLSAQLAEILADSPRPPAYSASRQRSPPHSRRQAVDPPEDYSLPAYHYNGHQMSPPTSMQEILDGEYINKARWQDQIDDDSVELPDHQSTAISHRSSGNNSNMTGMTTETQVVLHDRERQRKMGSRQYQYQYRY